MATKYIPVFKDREGNVGVFPYEELTFDEKEKAVDFFPHIGGVLAAAIMAAIIYNDLEPGEPIEVNDDENIKGVGITNNWNLQFVVMSGPVFDKANEEQPVDAEVADV